MSCHDLGLVAPMPRTGWPCPSGTPVFAWRFSCVISFIISSVFSSEPLSFIKDDINVSDCHVGFFNTELGARRGESPGLSHLKAGNYGGVDFITLREL